MNVGPNFLHLVLLVGAAACVALTLRELGQRPMSLQRAAAPAFVAGACALVFFLLKVANGHPAWTFGAALAAGFAGGVVRGFTLKLQIDHMYAVVRLPRARGSMLVALFLLGAVLLDIGGAITGVAGSPFRLVAPDVAAACSGILAGRMLPIAMRWRSETHVDLRRM